LSITKVSKKGQITLHEHVRKALGIEPGDLLEEQVESGKIILKPSESPSVSLRGIGRKTKKRLKFVDSTEFLRRTRREDREEL
jgi:AbrB family looped-hinge helix DNA binding protein